MSVTEERLIEIIRDELSKTSDVSTCNLHAGMDEKQHAEAHAWLQTWMEFFQEANKIKWIIPRTIVKVFTQMIAGAALIWMLGYFGYKLVSTGGG